MAVVTVTPDEWQFVAFDSGRIAAVAEKLLGEIGLDVDLKVEVDETTPMGRVSTSSLQPLVIAVESGAFEDPKRPRQLSEQAVADVLGRLLHRCADRIDPAFGDPPPDVALTCSSRRRGTPTPSVAAPARLPRAAPAPLYHFRNRTASATWPTPLRPAVGRVRPHVGRHPGVCDETDGVEVGRVG
jgi:hypothetical protein